MRGTDHWLNLGIRHPLWDLHRFYLSLAKKGRSYQAQWLEELRSHKRIELADQSQLPIAPSVVALFFEYAAERERQFEQSMEYLRSEAEALAFCKRLGVTVGHTATQSGDHHQSSKAMIAAVSKIATDACKRTGLSVETDPQSRCVWCTEQGLHVSARNLDGAVPTLANPSIVWEIKEYWGKTKGGSKMSDAVYECHLVGLELRDYESRGGQKVTHVVFVDGREQWGVRKSDLRRLLDLMNQGLVDHLIVGREVESEWERVLHGIIGYKKGVGSAPMSQTYPKNPL